MSLDRWVYLSDGHMNCAKDDGSVGEPTAGKRRLPREGRRKVSTVIG